MRSSPEHRFGHELDGRRKRQRRVTSQMPAQVQCVFANLNVAIWRITPDLWIVNFKTMLFLLGLFLEALENLWPFPAPNARAASQGPEVEGNFPTLFNESHLSANFWAIDFLQYFIFRIAPKMFVILFQWQLFDLAWIFHMFTWAIISGALGRDNLPLPCPISGSFDACWTILLRLGIPMTNFEAFDWREKSRNAVIITVYKHSINCRAFSNLRRSKVSG